VAEIWRSLLYGVIGGLVVALITIWAGTRDPATLLIRVLISFAAITVAFELAQRPQIRSALPSIQLELGDGFALRFRPPAGGSKRRLRRQTLALVKDMRAHALAQGNPATPDYEQTTREWAEMDAATDEVTKTEIFRRHTQEHLARSHHSQLVLDGLFGGRILHVLNEFERRGLVVGGNARDIEWLAHSEYWLGEAASKLEALALQL
jgi:hypothetical protein